jgi:(2R)-ethylmalonyl-CoA mutase
VFTPKDFGLNEIMAEFVTLIRRSRGLPDAERAAQPA